MTVLARRIAWRLVIAAIAALALGANGCGSSGGPDADAAMPGADANADRAFDHTAPGDATDTSGAADAADASGADTSDADDASGASDASPVGDAPDAADAGADHASDGPEVGDAGPTPDRAPDAPSDGGVPDAPDGGMPDAPDGGMPDVPADGEPEAGVDAGAPEGGAPDATPPWTPGAITNLVLWLESDRGIDVAPGAKVALWRDQSGLDNDAQQMDAAYAPRLGASLSGQPVLEFTSDTWMLVQDHASMRWGFEDFAVYLVFRSTGTCDGPPNCYVQVLYRKQDTGAPWIGPGLGILPFGQLELRISDPAEQHLMSAKTGYDSGGTHLLGGLRRAFRPVLRINGAEILGPAPTQVLDVDAPGQHVYVGAHGMQHDPPWEFSFTGQMSAIVAVKGRLSDGELAQLERYLMTKYGVAPNLSSP